MDIKARKQCTEKTEFIKCKYQQYTVSSPCKLSSNVQCNNIMRERPYKRRISTMIWMYVCTHAILYVRALNALSVISNEKCVHTKKETLENIRTTETYIGIVSFLWASEVDATKQAQHTHRI